MARHSMRHPAVMAGLGLLAGFVLALAPACAGKGKGSRNPEECMKRCEEDVCGYDPNAWGNDEYLECLDGCESKCG
ncbi:hypothetical protein [Paraliomyxa miuraensis]|uniref:hypothetical protein n=1 Tax=Paraliomyxa miuraensis TaxID=376150 RepID=UPI002254433F|nr:hypothetical protein [Paraliomyxa miuraensis]MCX4241874.1 hypothetical protein [Paraliomyxa miuraensis]